MINSKEGLLVDRVKHALHTQVSSMIKNGEITLPKERELATQYGVSVRTVRTALDELKQKRILHSIPGKGTFIVPATKRKQLTLILTNNISHPFTAAATEIIMDILREKEMPASISVVTNGQTNWENMGFTPNDIGGIIVLAPAIDINELNKLKRSGVPMVILGDLPATFRHPLPCHQIRSDSYSCSYLATRYLLQQGHKQILMACWGGNTSWGRDLKRGYKDALKEAKIPSNPEHIIIPPRVEFSETNKNHLIELGDTQKSLDQILSGANAPSAVIHNSSIQMQAQEMMHSYFHDKFSPDATIVMTHNEILKSYYFNSKQTLAVAMPFRHLVNAAINILKNKYNDNESLALTIDGYRILQRNNENWKPV